MSNSSGCLLPESRGPGELSVPIDIGFGNPERGHILCSLVIHHIA